jgi:hypothetical protein
MKRVKEGEILVTTTDKSKKIVVTTPDDYRKAAAVHIGKDKEVQWSELAKVEKEVDCNVRQLLKIFKVGEAHGQEARCKEALITEDRPPPGVRFCFKDHKVLKEGEVVPPTRMVCGATEGPLHRGSILADKILRPIADELEAALNTEVRSTEEVKRKFRDLNVKIRKEREEIEEEGFEEDREMVFFSQDVKALYPRIEAEEAGKIVEEKIIESDLEWEGIEWQEVGKHLAVLMSKEEKKEMEIEDVLPNKTKAEGSKVKVTYLDTNFHKDKSPKWTWEGKREASKEEKRKMMGRLMRKIVVIIMGNHLYQFDGKLYRQLTGGPIGLLLTGTISRIVMLEWDKIFLRKLEGMDLSPEMYFRYVDDQGVGMWAVPAGMKFVNGMIVIDEEEKKLDKKPDRRTAELFRDIGNSVMEMIQLEEEYPSKHKNDRVPVLDLEVWMEDNEVRHTHYRKPMATRRMVTAKSAISEQAKRAIVTEEGMRRLRNVSQELVEGEQDGMLVGFNLDMKDSGYEGSFREGITKRIIEKFRGECENNLKWELGEEGGKPANRTAKEREEQRETKGGNRSKEGWFRGGGFTSTIWVPATPEGELAKRIQAALELTEAPKGTKPKVVQLGGRATSQSLVKGNPFPRKHCQRQDCQICWQEVQEAKEGSNSICFQGNIGYLGQCLRCPAKDREQGVEEGRERQCLYIGESSKTLYRRTAQHIREYLKKSDRSWMWEHTREQHEGIIGGEGKGGREDYKFSLAGSFKNCTTRITDESTRIKREEEGKAEAGVGKGEVTLLNTKHEFHKSKDVRVEYVQL